MRRKPIQAERLEQETLISWFKLVYPAELLVAIPNGLARRNNAAMSVKGGLMPGMPDLMLCAKRKGYGGMFIELKRPSVFGCKAGVASVSQIDVLKKLNDLGYYAVLAYGWVEASKMIGEYLNE